MIYALFPAVVIILMATILWKTPIYRWLFLPGRAPDFIERHWEVWMDEGVGFSNLLGKRFKFVITNEAPYLVITKGTYQSSIERTLMLRAKTFTDTQFENIFFK